MALEKYGHLLGTGVFGLGVIPPRSGVGMARTPLQWRNNPWPR